MAVMAFAGMSVAQDIYYSGYYSTGGMHLPAVYKNGSKLYDVTNFTSKHGESTDVITYNGDVYWVMNCNNTDGTYYYGDIKKNSSTYFDSPVDQGYHINDLELYGSNIIAAGCRNNSGVKTATLWENSNTSPYFTLGDGTYPSEAMACTRASFSDGIWTITVGFQYTSSSSYKGVVWRGGSEYYNLGTSISPQDVAVYDGDIYVVANDHSGSTTTAKVYKNGTVLYSLSSSNSRCFGLSIDAGDIYVCGWEGSYFEVWKNGETWDAFTGSGNVRDITVNANGRYYVGAHNSQGKVWKNTNVLYSPSNCDYLYGMHIDEPECTNSNVRSLPFYDGFEQGNTSWACWTKIDVDNQNNGRVSYWDRVGKRLYSSLPTGNECARHVRNSDNAQEGWLITPRLFLQPGRDATTLTFKTSEYRPGYYGYEGVWVSTNSDPTNRSSYTQVWTQTAANASTSWKDVTIDLSDYQGEAVYIAFKYTGTDAHVWLIDEVNVTETWSPCSSSTVPYTFTFDNWNTHGTCWYIWDSDKSGGNKCWKYYSSDQCAYHPYGQSGVAQYGCLVSPNITLASGHDYVLKFKTKSTSSGSNMANRIYIKLDGTGVPDPSTYGTMIWSDSQFSSSWTEIEVPLSSYAGHDISFSFEYTGTYAHNWFIDDVRVEEAIAQYTITANANNSSWGSVTGGGTYNAGATCTLTATPASGYQFDSWKKNGSVVSTNPNYSFTVTENATYTAYFSQTPVTYYTITTNVSPTGAGTVTGGGTFPAGSSITLTASANNGYTFSQWQDGSTANPRTITVNGNATYTATFTQDNYTINVYANPTNGGTVYGGGSYHYGDTPTIGANPASGFEFAGWNDGNTQNPRQITVIGNANYTATFNEVGVTMYTVTTDVSPAGAGTVSGGGTFEAGTSIVLTAMANPGYTFDHWNDGSTTNPRTVTVNSNMSFTAYFTQNQYTITVVANPPTGGSVSGGGAYYYGDYATLTANAYSGYEFVGWSDGSSENPHQVLVTGNATYTATFSEAGATYYTVSAYVSPAGSGTVSGTGTFPAGSTTTLTATANPGYTFDHWNDGSTTNPRTVTVNNNMSFTAFFTAQQYTITVNANPTEGGTVSGGGSYAYGATATLQATPNANYEFMQWSDGNVENPRYVTVTGNATYTALFVTEGGELYTLTLTSAQPLLGQVFGGGTYPAGSSVEIRALPATYARFVKWSDGNTQNPRTLVINSNMELQAEFVATQNYTITVVSANPEMGQAFGGGTYQEGAEVQIAAVAYGGYMFDRWNDGNTQNPRTITVTGDATYTASFKESSVVTYTLTLVCNTEEGSVSGGGIYVAGTNATIEAYANDGFVFDKWSDGNSDNPRTITMTSDLTLAALFKGTGVNELDLNNYQVFPNPAHESIYLLGIEDNTTVEIYNSLGELVKVVSVSANQEIGLRDMASGLYLVRFGNVTLRFVKD